jgi:outer membrane protein OmpA-like peptidoglycan-associated protein
MEIKNSILLKLSTIATLVGLAACAHDTNKLTAKFDSSSPATAVESTTAILDKLSSVVGTVTGVFDAALASWRPLNVAGSTQIKTALSVTDLIVWKPLNAPVQVELVATAPSIEQVLPQVAEARLPQFKLKMDARLDSLKYAVYFDYASANLNPTGKAAIEALQSDVKEAESIVIIGYADPSGDAKKNVKLADSRAKTVRLEFAKYGTGSQRIITKGAVLLSKSEDRVAFKQNVPADLAATSRRADVDIVVKPNATAKSAPSDKRFVSILG